MVIAIIVKLIIVMSVTDNTTLLDYDVMLWPLALWWLVNYSWALYIVYYISIINMG